ncbi:hypothetical protein [Kordia zhangzhouensis]|uniref:hypothetical protein n=1 Tax=Kordia zhangzhouensis TaxID=1620405 RepID=UPI000629D144|nr:hypothetical protein [Kordia zhangzhouensis]
MEKSVLLILALLVGIVIGYFICKKLHGGDSPGNGNPPTNTPDGIISVYDAINLHETYKNTRYQLINDAIGGTDSNFLDTQFVWFEYERMKNYMQYLATVEEKNPNNPKISGVRVYFGAYNQHNQYPQQQTVFFNPTIETTLDEKHSNMKNLPFYIVPNATTEPLVGQYKVIERLLIDEYNATERAFMANNSLGHKQSSKEKLAKESNPENGDDGTSLSFNIGHLSPPPPRG